MFRFAPPRFASRFTPRFAAFIAFLLPLLISQFSPQNSAKLAAAELSYEDFKAAAFQNSAELITQNAMTQSIKSEGAAWSAWENPSVEISPSFTRNAATKRLETQGQILLMITPKMPWVSGIIADAYATKALKSETMLQLQKNLIAIGLKKSYLSYLIFKEQLGIYENKEELAKNALDIAQKRFEANRISKAELLRFKSDHSAALGLLRAQDSLVKSQLSALRILANAPEFSAIYDLDFYFLPQISLSNRAESSIYREILRLDALDFEQSGKALSRSRMDALSFGAGYTVGANSIDLKFIIPLPFSTKYGHQKDALYALRAASLKNTEIKKQTIAKSASALEAQLLEQKTLIDLALANEINQKELFEIMQKGFDAGVVGVFEYLNTKNAYLTSRIQTTQEKLNYINLFALLEETLGTEILEHEPPGAPKNGAENGGENEGKENSKKDGE